MNINLAFGAAGDAAAMQEEAHRTGTKSFARSVPPAGSGSEHHPESLPDAPPAEPTAAEGTAHEPSVPAFKQAASRPMFTRAATAQRVPDAEQVDSVNQQEAPAEATKNDAPARSIRWRWRPTGKPGKTDEASSSAKVPNKSRPAVIIAAMFVAGIVAGPWLLQKTAPAQPQAAGPNPSVQAVADTLNRGTFANAPASPVAVPNEVAAPTPAADVKDPIIPAAGEERYAAMLERMRAGGQAQPQEPITVIKKINAAQQPTPTTSSQVDGSATPKDPYPAEAIPLEIEKTAKSAKAQEQAIVIERHLSPSGNYTVLRIERNPQGQLAALLMPTGGRQAIDSAWVFVGDATTDGMVIENITGNSVVLRTPSGRSIQIAVH
ncbi:hypothetical protein RQP54_18505 [Curvibacter sp. APW13]|uniref:hypothetical protein n=1 Tax=Curvibacter sp. APW13 TaxID=3077236 RepID=UPI0028E09E35|nr:hypothetical protein [Curvibacter sp. APW13]MDT8992872.1 hypothetical protein [Curvibacter sp. APW13]